MSVALNLAVDIVIIALAAWFWPHCARPALIAQRAGPLAYRLVLGVTVFMILTQVVGAAVDLAQIGGPMKWWITAIGGGLWIGVVGLGYPQYNLLLRFSGGRSE